MSDPLQLARSARENLARGLGALQGDPSVPAALVDLAAPIAQAMGALHQIERSQGAALMPHAETALTHVRSALSQLQTHTGGHPAVDAAMEAVAGSLGHIHALHKLTQGPAMVMPTPAAPRPTPPLGQPATAAPAPVPNTTAMMDPPRVEPLQPAPKPVQTAHNPAPAPVQQPAPGFATAPTQLPQQVPAGPPAGVATAPVAFAPTQLPHQAPGAPPAGMAPPAGPPAGMAPPAGPPAGMAPPGAPPAAMAPPAAGPPPHQTAPSFQAVADPFARRNSPSPEAPPAANGAGGPQRASVPVPSPPAQNGAAVIEAALGAHSPTNFYKGLSGNDIIDHGGLFVATYMVPKIGTPVRLKVSLPGGYEFEANAVVKWARDAEGDGGVQPGFGARLTEISSEARQLVYRYVRNREPLFHDDF